MPTLVICVDDKNQDSVPPEYQVREGKTYTKIGDYSCVHKPVAWSRQFVIAESHKPVAWSFCHCNPYGITSFAAYRFRELNNPNFKEEETHEGERQPVTAQA